MKLDVLTPVQFDVSVASAEVDGIEMGVLGDGTPYLTERGLARACGQPPAVMRKLSEHWGSPCDELHCRRIGALLPLYVDPDERRFRDITVDGRKTRVFPVNVALAVLEYFAFDSRAPTVPIARATHRMLMRACARRFVYAHTGYGPDQGMSESWRFLHHRMVLNPLPSGYFSVFRELAGVLIAAAQSGLTLDAHTLPDLSVGGGWGRYWRDHDFDAVYGPRIKHPHHFPASSGRDADIEAWIYPLAALASFRAWMRDDYVPYRLPAYLRNKAAAGALAPAHVDHLFAAISAEHAA
ncbi:hypothetical protein [Haliangium sp.]|uniref:hypothetical protein n=1 Tax=Haliangium sp. TaxID=2663208 RepID=UPI003D0FB6CF